MRHSVKVIIITIKCFIIVTSLLCHPCKRQMCKSSQLMYLFFGEAPNVVWAMAISKYDLYFQKYWEMHT